MRSRLSSLCALAVCLGCSLVNKFDDLKAVKPDAGDGSSGTAGTAGSGGTSGGSGTAGGGASGSSGMAGGGSGGVLQDGLIVVYGQKAATLPVQNVISVISPWTGVELLRTNAKATVRAVVYDGDQDLWFVFYANPGAFGVNATISIGKFEIATGKFIDLTPPMAPLVPVPFDQNQVAVLNKRIMYVSANTAMVQGMALLDTTQVAGKPAVAVLGSPPLGPQPAGGVAALLAHPSSQNPGGVVTVVQQDQVGTECMDEADAGVPDGGTAIKDCPVKVLSATVKATDTAPSYGTPTTVGLVRDGQWSAGWVSDGKALGNDYVLLPPKAFSTSSVGTLYKLFSSNLAMMPMPLSFPFTGPRISSTTFDSCRDIVFTGELKTVQTITAIPLPASGTGTPAIVQEGKSVQHLTFEPFTRSLIMTFDDANNPAFDAWVIEGTDAAPIFTQRKASGTSSWNPPKDLVPKYIAVKLPSTPPCQ